MRKLLLISVAISVLISAFAVAPTAALGGTGAAEDQKEITIEKKDSCRAYLGIFMDELSGRLIRTHDYPEKDGVIIVEVIEESPAEKAGLQEDDIIFRFNGKKVDSAKGLSSMVREMKPGDEAEIVLYRDGDRKTLTVTLGEQTDEVSIYDFENYAEEIGDFAGRLGKSFGYWWHDAFGEKGRLGVELAELDEDLAGYFDVKENEGVLVLRVNEDGPAEEAGLKPGDVIVEMNGESVSRIDDLRDELADSDEDTVDLAIVRKGQRKSFEVALRGEDRRFFYIPPRAEKRIVIPEKRFESIETFEMEKEIEELKAELKEMKKRLKELEKE